MKLSTEEVVENIALEIQNHFGEEDYEDVSKFLHKFTCVCGAELFVDEHSTNISTYENAISYHIAEIITHQLQASMNNQ